MKTCKCHVTGPLKEMVVLANPERQLFTAMGIENLMENLRRPSVKQRLVALAEYGI